MRIQRPAVVTTKPASPANDAVITKQLKKSFEMAMKATGGRALFTGNGVFKNAKEVATSALPAKALAKFNEYASTGASGLYNGSELFTKVAVIDGQKVFMVGGDLSDTGSEVSFFNAKGKLLAQAYAGQGEKKNANGVDWEK